jgi:hypothetical protein
VNLQVLQNAGDFWLAEQLLASLEALTVVSCNWAVHTPPLRFTPLRHLVCMTL